jgi:hypothetical protein
MKKRSHPPRAVNAFKIVLCLVLLSLQFNAFAKSLPLIIKGKSNYMIVVSPKAREAEQQAALLLQKHMALITGVELPIGSALNKGKNGIYIEVSPAIANVDGFSISTKNKGLYIQGGSHKGCLYAVVSLLEKYMGCHYYSATYKEIPQSKDIVLPEINWKDEPKNDVRIVYIVDKAVGQEFLDWNRLHTVDDFFAKGYYVHTFEKLVPWQEYFKTHPEYFAEMNGKRNKDQLCVSNPQVLELAIEKLKKEMLLQPSKLYWSVSQNDNFSYCQCEKCNKTIAEEGSPAGPIIRFVNEVAKEFPDKIISTLAYQYSRKAPVLTKPAQNVQVMLCTIELNRSKSIEEDKTSESFKNDIIDWGKICKYIYLWDYNIDFANSVSPFPNLHVLQPNIQFFVNNNVSAHFQQANAAVGSEFSELKVYLLSRLLWNPNADAAQISTEFLEGYYGKAAPWIKKYSDQLESELKKSGDRLDIYEHPTSHQNSFLSQENIKQYNTFFDNAEKAAQNDPAQLLHVKVARLPLQFAIMEIGKNDMFGSRGWYVQKDGDFTVNPVMVQLLEDFNKVCQEAKVDHLNEAGLSPQDYYQSSKRFLEVQVKGNLAFKGKVSADTKPSPNYSGGNLDYLTNGVRGASDYKIHWLGWSGKDFSVMVDLEKSVAAQSIEISSLWDPKSWILHPEEVNCLVSENGKDFVSIGKVMTQGNQEKEEVTKVFSFKGLRTAIRYVKFEIKGTKQLPQWHPSAGGESWVFIDEIVVR